MTLISIGLWSEKVVKVCNESKVLYPVCMIKYYQNMFAKCFCNLATFELEKFIIYSNKENSWINYLENKNFLGGKFLLELELLICAFGALDWILKRSYYKDLTKWCNKVLLLLSIVARSNQRISYKNNLHFCFI